MASCINKRCFYMALTICLMVFVTFTSWFEYNYADRYRTNRVPLEKGNYTNYLRWRVPAAAADDDDGGGGGGGGDVEELRRLMDTHMIADEDVRTGSSVAMEINTTWSELNMGPPLFDGKHFGNLHRLVASGASDSRAYVNMVESTKVFFYSVIAMNSSETASWDLYKINGWEPHKYMSKKYKCCFMYKNKIVENHFPHRDVYLHKRWDLCIEARQYVCQDPLRSAVNNKRPLGVTLTEDDRACPKSPLFYLKPYYPQVPPKYSFVVYVKPIYGSVDAGRVVEWLEFVKFFGVHKVYMYPEDTINADALAVLLYYVSTGFVDLSPIGTLPLKGAKDHCRRKWTDRTNKLVGQEEQVFTFDAQARIHGYQYGAILDIDEFVVPGIKHKSYVEFMDYMLTLPKYHVASSFRMQSLYHIMDWGQTGSGGGGLQMARYINRTDPMIDAPKHFFVTDRVVPGSINFHANTPKKGYKTFTLPTEYIALHHYRRCKRKWKYKNYNKCFDGFKRKIDHTMLAIAEQILPRISRVLQHLFTST